MAWTQGRHVDLTGYDVGHYRRLRGLPSELMKLSLHQIEALVKAGVKDIVLAVNYRPEVMVSVLKKSEEEFGINIHFSVETEPLGTGQCCQPLISRDLF
jgi:hypothetical protein